MKALLFSILALTLTTTAHAGGGSDQTKLQGLTCTVALMTDKEWYAVDSVHNPNVFTITSNESITYYDTTVKPGLKASVSVHSNGQISVTLSDVKGGYQSMSSGWISEKTQWVSAHLSKGAVGDYTKPHVEFEAGCIPTALVKSAFPSYR